MLALLSGTLMGRESRTRNVLTKADDSFFRTDSAMRVGLRLLDWQRNTGAWPKNVEMAVPLDDEARSRVLADKERRDDSTIDNRATTMQMKFLARLYRETHDARFRDAFLRGVKYLLDAQYDNGGWPQFWPETIGYQEHITYNDDAMVRVMYVLRDIASGTAPYDGDLVSGDMRRRAQEAFDKGIECILATQMECNGTLTVWCQQHDHVTLLPAPARAYELPSYCTSESASIVALLMELPQPDQRVVRAVDAAMAWFERTQLKGIRVEYVRGEDGKLADVKVVKDAKARPLWARFYDLKDCQPFFCDRDGIPRRNLSEIGFERRTGYGWYSGAPGELKKQYKKFKKSLPKSVK